MTPPAFVGDWLVSEYVYTPAGEFVGVVRQRRVLQPQGDVIRVIQVCEPVLIAQGISAAGQEVARVMNQRVGEFVFDLKIVGKARHYLGPDVLGGGFSWKDGVLTARGMWPRFGYNFTSFSMLVNPRRQVTGGRFFFANQELATIVGAAVPEDEGFPTLEPGSPAGQYRGERHLISPDGELLRTDEVTATESTLSEADGLVGNQKRYGALLEIESVNAPGLVTSALEVTDVVSGSVAGIWKQVQDEKLKAVQIYLLKNQF